MRKNISALVGLACVTATALLTVPPAADAASRNFKIENESSETFVLKEVERVKCERGDDNCMGHTRANLVYGDFEVLISTTNYSNNSRGWVYRDENADIRCIADGRSIRIRDR